MEPLDLSRPPSPLPPRLPIWVILSVLWAVGFVVLYFDYSVGAEPPSPSKLPILTVLLVIALSITTVGLILIQSGRRRLFVNSASWTGEAYPQDDPSDETRLADRAEVEARHDLRHHRITRAHYERILARRQFVHGELTRAQFQERIAEIAAAEAVAEQAAKSSSKGKDRS